MVEAAYFKASQRQALPNRALSDKF